MNEENHYYIAGYSVEDDPYCQSNGVLINNYNITSTAELNIIEARSSSLTLQMLSTQKIPKEFNTETLQKYHKEIFNNIYPWAGQFRQVDIAKGDNHFESHKNINIKLEVLFTDCKNKKFFIGLSQDEFAKESADFLTTLNKIHR